MKFYFIRVIFFRKIETIANTTRKFSSAVTVLHWNKIPKNRMK